MAKTSPAKVQLVVVTAEGVRTKVSAAQLSGFKWTKGAKLILVDEVSKKVLKDVVAKRVGNDVWLESQALSKPLVLKATHLPAKVLEADVDVTPRAKSVTVPEAAVAHSSSAPASKAVANTAQVSASVAPLEAKTADVVSTSASGHAATPVADFSSGINMAWVGAGLGALALAGGGGGGGSSSPVVTNAPFSLTTTVEGLVTFAGTSAAHVDGITVAISGGVATFTAGGNTAATTVTSLAGKTLQLAAGQKLVMTDEQLVTLVGLKVTGAGDFWIDANDAGSNVHTVNKVLTLNVELQGGNLKVDMTDDTDSVVLSADSVVNLHGGDLIVSDGVLDVTRIANPGRFEGVANVIINSGLKLSVAQLATMTGKIVTADDGAPGSWVFSGR